MKKFNIEKTSRKNLAAIICLTLVQQAVEILEKRLPHQE